MIGLTLILGALTIYACPRWEARHGVVTVRQAMAIIRGRR